MDVESQETLPCYAYKIVNAVNGKIYIGITQRPVVMRWKAHLYPGRKSKSTVSLAIRKYGKAAFSIEVVAQAKCLADIYDVERALVVQWNSLVPNGYNRAPGGQNGSLLGHSVSEVTRLKIRAAQVGIKRRPLTEQERQAQSLRQKGKRQSPEHIEKVRLVHLGKKRSTEACANISRAHMGITQSLETKAKHRAYRHTPEARAAIRAAVIARWAEARA